MLGYICVVVSTVWMYLYDPNFFDLVALTLASGCKRNLKGYMLVLFWISHDS